MGLLLIDKPKNITSHDVIDKLRKITGIGKIGHAGTLDPNATGLLICAITREYTKKLGELTLNTSKTYLAEITLGEERDTLDSEGRITNTHNDSKPGLEEVKQVLRRYKGELEQIPPIYSAIKLKGKKAYDLARAGKNIEMKKRNIIIYKNNLVNYNYPILSIEFEVSAGTYIRSLARDIGHDLGTGGYLSNLRRIKIGEYDLEDAIELDKLNADNWKDFEVIK